MEKSRIINANKSNVRNISNDNKPKSILREKQFEILNHLKQNIKNNQSGLCDFHESNLNMYCTFCKQPICEVCEQTIHSCHYVIKKENFPFSYKYFESLFTKFDKEIAEIEATIQPVQLLKNVKKNIELEMNDLIEKLNDVKAKRLKEVDSMFVSTGFDCTNIKNTIKQTKDIINKYTNKYKSFLDINVINDYDCFIFLQTLDLDNEVNTKIDNYMKIIAQVKQAYNGINLAQDNRFTEISKMIDKLLLDQKKKDIQKANSKIWSSLDEDQIKMKNLSGNIEDESGGTYGNQVTKKFSEYYQKINEDNFQSIREKISALDNFQENFKQKVYESVKKHQSMNEISKIVKGFDQKIAKKVILGHSGTRKISLNKSSVSKAILSSSGEINRPIKNKQTQSKSPSKRFERNNDKSVDKSKDISNTVDEKKKEEEMDSDDVKSKGSNDNIEVDYSLNNIINRKNQQITRVIERVFKPKPKKPAIPVVSKYQMEMIKKKKQEEDKYKVNVELQQSIIENEKIVKALNSRDKVSLTHPLVRKFYSFNFLDFVRNTYSRFQDKDNEKSIQELFDLQTIDNDPFKNCVVKVIEGTDEIHIYNKSTKKINKIKVEMDSKKYGTKIFYKGCKSFHTQGKVYISGGKDMYGDKTLFMVYNITEKKLSRLHDMKYPRSFHSFIFQDSMRALLAVGGEHNNSCELYDFYLNMWNDFPELNFSRACPEVVFNSNNTLAYAMFGIVGDFTKKIMTDVIEVIDIIDLNKGWYKVEYTNNTGVDLKSNSILTYNLPNDKLLLYGGVTQKSSQQMYVLFDLKTFEMSKVDLRQAEIIKKMAIEEEDKEKEREKELENIKNKETANLTKDLNKDNKEKNKIMKLSSKKNSVSISFN